MANIKQQKKRVGIASRQRLENLRYRSTIKTLAKRLETAVADGDSGAIATEHRELVRTIDRAAARGALHKNTAARKKSQAERVVRGASGLARPRHVGDRELELEVGRELAAALERVVELGESEGRVVELLGGERLGLTRELLRGELLHPELRGGLLRAETRTRAALSCE